LLQHGTNPRFVMKALRSHCKTIALDRTNTRTLFLREPISGTTFCTLACNKRLVQKVYDRFLWYLQSGALFSEFVKGKYATHGPTNMAKIDVQKNVLCMSLKSSELRVDKIGERLVMGITK
jgi:hypothetical protein